MPRTTATPLAIDDILKDAQAKVSEALDATRAALQEKEAELDPLRQRVREYEQTLARLDGSPSTPPAAAMTDEERARRAALRKERRDKRKAAATLAVADAPIA